MKYSQVAREARNREIRFNQFRNQLKGNNPAIVPFAEQWADEMERRMALTRGGGEGMPGTSPLPPSRLWAARISGRSKSSRLSRSLPNAGSTA